MSKNITFTIANIPEVQFNNVCRFAIRTAKKDYGIDLKVPDHIIIDFGLLMESYPEMFPQILSSILTCNTINAVTEKLNQ